MRFICLAIGVVALAATAAAQPASGPVLTKEKREAAFDAADTNHDGKLSRAEFDKTIPGPLAKTGATQFNSRDTNSDGFLSKAEYSAVAQPATN
jgi:hypothetical protein